MCCQRQLNFQSFALLSLSGAALSSLWYCWYCSSEQSACLQARLPGQVGEEYRGISLSVSSCCHHIAELVKGLSDLQGRRLPGLCCLLWSGPFCLFCSLAGHVWTSQEVLQHVGPTGVQDKAACYIWIAFSCSTNPPQHPWMGRRVLAWEDLLTDQTVWVVRSLQVLQGRILRSSRLNLD